MSTRRAFSLFELVIVIAIIGIAAALAVPRYGKSLSRYRAQLAAERVAEELRVAAEHARARECSVTATVSTGTEIITVIETSGLYTGDVVATTAIGAAPYEADLYLTLRGASIGSPTFNAMGLPQSDAMIVVMSGDIYVVVALKEGDPRPAVWEPRLWGGHNLDLSDPADPSGTYVVDATGTQVVGG